MRGAQLLLLCCCRLWESARTTPCCCTTPWWCRFRCRCLGSTCLVTLPCVSWLWRRLRRSADTNSGGESSGTCLPWCVLWRREVDTQ
ncbi:hypothetical protein KC19_VG221100 [Ceratodon purpureus]|uniref:Secreted protein n=1 Tax=Ceratodon purpureus TaxID=3225 RepID=A0A8T0HSL6_CERPU|nr:hypothetical protein KC19_VG221100 [Ceratodon purpureus]